MNRAFSKILILIILIIFAAGGIFVWQYLSRGEALRDFGAPEEKVFSSQPPSLPTTCQDEPEGQPVITSLSSYSGPVGTKLEIRGCNFSGFEGDKNAWIENSQGAKGFLYGEAGSTSNLLKITLKSPLCQGDTSYSGLPCDAWLTLTSGVYKIYVMPWGKKSNEVNFTIQSIDETVDWKTYKNTIFDFSFKYPPDWKINNDTIPEGYTKITGPKEYLEISNNLVPEEPKLVLYVNPDGFGPFPIDIRYTLSLTEEGMLKVIEREEEKNQDGKIWIANTLPLGQTFGGNTYWFHFLFKEGGQDLEPIFNQMLSTFRFLE